MKALTIILGILVLNSCLLAAEAPLVHLDAARIQDIAIKAITTKYSDVKSADLALKALNYEWVDDVSEGLITVSYKQTLSENENIGTTRYQQIRVAMSEYGEIRDVSRGKIFTNQVPNNALQPTATAPSVSTNK